MTEPKLVETMVTKTYSMFVRGAAVSLLVLIATACGTLSLSADTSGGAAPIIQIAQTPADTVRAFLDAWNQHDYTAMYAQLSSTSQSLNTFPVFQTVYQEADATLGTQGVRYTIRSTDEQGTTAAITYDATIDSSVFGSIEDNDRVMRVVRAPDNTWKVAWSSMDIINGYATGTRLRVDSVRPPRGNIYDHNGQLMVEQNSDVIELYAARAEMPNESACVDLLSVILRRSRADLTNLLDTYAPETVIPLGDVDPMIYSARERELTDTCTIRTNTRTTRRYVGHGIATHLIGYVGSIPAENLQRYLDDGYSSGDLVGLAGVEQAYETQLAGKSERVLRVVEPGGMTVRELAGTSSEPAHDITLTLDLNLQWATAQALSDAFNAAANNWASPEHSTGGAAVVIDVHTGAILALASYPTFDPGIINGDTPMFRVDQYIASLQTGERNAFANRATQEQYSPGSTFKIITLAAAAEERLWKPGDLFDCQMEWDGRPFGDTFSRRLDWRASEPNEEDRFPTGEVTMAEALTASCNPFFYQMGAELFNKGGAGAATLMNYARQMGLGKSTGLGNIVTEAQGQLQVVRSADESISAAVGQGDTQVTVLQMARMVAGVANGGTLYQPYVVQQVGGEDGSDPQFIAQPTIASDMGLSDSTLDIVHEGMCAVTTTAKVNRTNGKNLGTAWFVFDDADGTGIAPYTVCGKTGTAQTGRQEPNGWFVAYAPADDPQIAVAVVTQYSREGSETSAPIVRRILDAYFGAPQAPWPWWWTQDVYHPLNIPEGSTGG